MPDSSHTYPPPPAPEPAADVAPMFAMHGGEFVALMAALMALTALAIDSMLPALPEIARDLGAWSANAQQLVISFFLGGSALGSLVSGPLSDRFGRKTVLLAAVVLYIVAAVASAFAPSFSALLGIRLIHGLVASTFGVVSVSVIRDRFAGDRMARTMSTVFIVFMVVPVVAPTFGQFVLSVAPWQAIFAVLATLAAVVGVWTFARLPETLAEGDRQRLDARTLGRNWRHVVFNRVGAGYSFGAGIVTGGMFGFLNSSQQIFAQVFDARAIFPYAFAAVASTMALANFFNSRIVMRFGARRVSQTALLAFIGLSLCQLAAAAMPGEEPMWLFLSIVALNMGMVGFTGANFGSIAMQPFGHIAGAASSVQSFLRMGLGAVIGALIGAQFDGTTLPLALGFLTTGCIALGFVLFAERGRLFTRPNAPRQDG